MPVELFADNASTTLTSSPGVAATSFTVASLTGFPAASNATVPPTQFRVLIGTEMVTVTNVVGLTWTCLPTTVAHTTGDAVTQVVFAASLGGLQYPMNSGRAASLDFETFPRAHANGTSTQVSRSLYLTAIRLPRGYPVRKIGFYAAIGGGGSPVYSWFALHDNNRVMLAQTADQGSATWAVGLRLVPIASTAAGVATEFVTTYAGIYYLATCVKDATAAPSLAATTGQAGLNAIPPILSGAADPIMAAYPAFPFTAAAISPDTGTIWAGVGS